MNKQDFYFDLPKELIAQHPLANRIDSKLLRYHRETKQISHFLFPSILDSLNPGDLLVMNDSKVIPARLYGHKTSGGKIELLVEKILDERLFWAHIKASKALKKGAVVKLEHDRLITIIGRHDDLYVCEAKDSIMELLYQIGHIPLPPYITRSDEQQDHERYQTVYAKYAGSVAAPTAGLHFDDSILQELNEKKIQVDYLTLHVGSGTFRPVRCTNIKEHQMHSESFSISQELADRVNETKKEGKRVIAVGTTALRSLESAARHGQLEPCARDTNIFIYPGYKFQICDGLLTNFHLPESTLLMLVAAFIGHQETMAMYQEAIAHGYRFFSYGDASLLL